MRLSRSVRCILYSSLRSLVRCSLKGHGHWVNTMSLSTDYALRTGAYDHRGQAPTDPAEAKQVGNKF